VRLRPPSSAKQLEGGALLDWLRQQQPALLEAIAVYDHIVVNGEGTLHGGSGPALSLLSLALLAKRELGRPVHLVNHSCFPPRQQEDPLALGIYEATYCGADSVVVRERLSLENAARLGATPRLGFDSLPLFLESHPVVSEKSDTVVIAGSVAWSPASVAGLVALGDECERRGYRMIVLVGANGWIASDDVGFASMALKHLGPRAQLVCAESEGQWLREIARARLLVSGRFHHTIAAAFLGTPFLVGQTNTRKTVGAIEAMGFEPGQVMFGDAGPAADAIERALDGRLPVLDAGVAAGLRKLARENAALSAP
jgi:polysaccharide pyruvyl transferase WcaK-like protein